jgi:hypothetical protein
MSKILTFELSIMSKRKIQDKTTERNLMHFFSEKHKVDRNAIIEATNKDDSAPSIFNKQIDKTIPVADPNKLKK